MHEWALAEAVAATLSKYLEEAGGRKIKRLVIALGELQAIDREIFEFALNEVFKLYSIEIGEYSLVSEEAVFECRSCGYEWKLRNLEIPEDIREAMHFLPESAYAHMRCPRCGSPDYAVVKGRGLKIVGVEH